MNNNENIAPNQQDNDFLGFNEATSPFKQLNEEQVFITREAEKQKKKEAKEERKHLKIWDKKTATSSMPLKRIRDSDIQPAKSDENIYNFNSAQRGFISAACLISKSRVQYPREQRQQGIDEFVSQKKEMFLVELANNTIGNEIKDLEIKKTRKNYALQDSKLALEKDSEKLMNFIEEDNMKTKSKQKEAEVACEKRKAAEKQITLLEQQIHNQNSEIDKNEDLLRSLQDHKEFLFHLFATENPKWHHDQINNRRKKLDKIRERWIIQAKMSKENEMEEGDMQSEFTKQGDAAGTSQKGSMNDTQKSKKKGMSSSIAKQISDADWEQRFNDLLEQDLIDVPEDYYDEKILFSEPDELMEIFQSLEERNLEIIKKLQESESTLEARKHQEIRTQQEIGEMIEAQLQNHEELLSQIKVANATLSDLKKQNKQMTLSTEDKKLMAKKKTDDKDQDEEDIDHLMDEIRKDIEKIFKIFDNQATLEAKSGIEILQDIELRLNNQMNKLRYIHDKDEKFYLKLRTEVERRKELKAEQAKEKTENDRQNKKKEMQEKLKMKEQMRPKKYGKPTTTRSDKPKVKKVVKQKKIDPETQDQLDYLGLDLKQIPDIDIL